MDGVSQGGVAEDRSAGDRVDWVARARAMGPAIAAAADEVERLRELPRALTLALAEAGLFRLLLPRELGGGELTPMEFSDVMGEIAYHDASTAWCVGQGNGCGACAAFLGPEVAREIFGPDDGILAWGPPISSADVKKVPGGYRLTGSWSFASGSHNALFLVFLTLLGGTTCVAGSEAATLDKIRERGVVQCGVIRNGVGISTLNESGEWVGFFVDFCRAVAAATLQSASAVEFVELNQRTRFDATRDGAVDVFSSNTTWTLSRDAAMGLQFTNTLYYDGQGFIAPVSLNVKSMKDIRKATVCVTGNTTTEGNLAEYIRANRLDLTVITLTSNDTASSSFFSRRCDLYTTDRLALAGLRASGTNKPDDYVIFPEIISREPLGPVVRNDDSAWFAITKWVAFAMIAAEEKGVDSTNIARMRDSSDAETRRLLGVEPGLGKALGLDEAWATRVIEQVGNYGQVFERNLGSGSPLRLERGVNALWTKGGLIFAPPLR